MIALNRVSVVQALSTWRLGGGSLDRVTIVNFAGLAPRGEGAR